MSKQIPKSSPGTCKEDLVLDSGHLMVLGSEKEVVSFREQSTRSLGQHCGANVAGIYRKWTSYFPCNASILQVYSQEQRAWKASLYTSLQIKTQLIQFIALFFLSISSVSTEQWQLYAKNLRAIKMDRETLRF